MARNVRRAAVVGAGLWKLLQNEEVRRALRGASAGVVRWAKSRGTRADGVIDAGSRPALASLRFGRRSIERRLDALAAVIPDFAAVDAELGARLRNEEADLRTAARVAGFMPLTKRWAKERLISRRLGAIESELVDAVLAPH